LTGLDKYSEKEYKVLIPAGSFTDVNTGCTANGNADILDSIKIGDIVPPSIVLVSPKSAGDYVGLKLSMTF